MKFVRTKGSPVAEDVRECLECGNRWVEGVLFAEDSDERVFVCAKCIYAAEVAVREPSEYILGCEASRCSRTLVEFHKVRGNLPHGYWLCKEHGDEVKVGWVLMDDGYEASYAGGGELRMREAK